jgi:hypothetical protein
MIYFDSDMSKSTNTVVYFDWKTVIYIYVCGKCRIQIMLAIEKSEWKIKSNTWKSTRWRNLGRGFDRFLTLQASSENDWNSNLTSFFRFADKQAIYRWHNLIRTCAGECDWLFYWQHKLCVTFSVNVNYRLPIKVYYRICTLSASGSG